MGTFKLVTTAELRTRKQLSREDIVLFDQLKGYLSKLEIGYAGLYEFSSEDDQEKTVRILRRAAKAMDLRIRIVRDLASMTFYLRRSRKNRGHKVGAEQRR